MKKTALFLTILMALNFCACGGSGTNQEPPETKGPETQEEITSEPSEPSEPSSEDQGSTVGLGDAIQTDYLDMQLENAYISTRIGGNDGPYRTAGEGMKFFVVSGAVKNTGSSELNMGNSFIEMNFNDEFVYGGKSTVRYGNKLESTLPALMDGQFFLFAEVPNALVDQLSTGLIKFSFNDRFQETPETWEGGNNVYTIRLSEEDCQTALQGPPLEMVYFEECPVLPTPMSFFDMYQSGYQHSSSNGKVTKISYSYTSYGDESNTSLMSGYVDRVKALGFEAEQNGAEYKISRNGTLLATITADDKLNFDRVPGNEGMLRDESPAEAAEEAGAEEDDTITLALGEPISTGYVDMTMESAQTGDEIRTSAGDRGRYTYYSATDGTPFFYLTGTVKNTGTVPVDIRNVYAQVSFDGKYTYRADVDASAEGSGDFTRDISPLQSAVCFVYAEVPQELLDTYEVCTVKLGFTKGFDIKTVDVNNLPVFDKCDDVFAYRIERSQVQ